jgi:hypothetical protein
MIDAAPRIAVAIAAVWAGLAPGNHEVARSQST